MINNPLLDRILDDLKKNNDIIDHKYVRKLIKNWKISNFQLDNAGTMQNNFAKAELTKIFNKIQSSMQPTIMYHLLNKSNLEVQSALLDQFSMQAFTFMEICGGIYNYLAQKKNIENSGKKEDLAFANLTISLLDNFRSLLFSYISSDYITVIQKTRIIYECYVNFLFINKHKELSAPFLDHITIIENKIFRDKKSSEVLALMDKYGTDFQEDYGWTNSVILNKSNRKLRFMAQEVGFNDPGFDQIYKLSSNLIHTNSYSTVIRTHINRSNANAYLLFCSGILIRHTSFFTAILSDDKKEIDFISALLGCLEDILTPEEVINNNLFNS